MPLTREEAQVLAELEADVEAPLEPPEGPVRPERFSDFPVGLDDQGRPFPLQPEDEESPETAPLSRR